MGGTVDRQTGSATDDGAAHAERKEDARAHQAAHRAAGDAHAGAAHAVRAHGARLDLEHLTARARRIRRRRLRPHRQAGVVNNSGGPMDTARRMLLPVLVIVALVLAAAPARAAEVDG